MLTVHIAIYRYMKEGKVMAMKIFATVIETAIYVAT